MSIYYIGTIPLCCGTLLAAVLTWKLELALCPTHRMRWNVPRKFKYTGLGIRSQLWTKLSDQLEFQVQVRVIDKLIARLWEQIKAQIHDQISEEVEHATK